MLKLISSEKKDAPPQQPTRKAPKRVTNGRTLRLVTDESPEPPTTPKNGTAALLQRVA